MSTNTITVEVTIDLANLHRYVGTDEDGPHYEPMTLEEAVLAETGRVLAGRVAKDVNVHELARVARTSLEERIRTELEPLVGEALTQAITPTNTYGEPIREATTLRELIVARALEELTTPKERGYGKPRSTLVQHIIAEEVGLALRQELTEAIAEARKEVVAAVRAKGAEVIADTITKLAGASR